MTSTVDRHVPVGEIMTCCLALTVLAGPVGGQEQRCPDGDERVVRVSVGIQYDTGEISVSPSTVEIQLREGPAGPSRVCWVVSDLEEGDRLYFRDKDPESPDYFPGLRRMVTASSPFANSGNPSRAGRWSYALQVVAPDGGVVAEVDPEVIIDDSG